MCEHVRVRRSRLHPNAQPRRYPRSVYKHHVISAKDGPELGVVLTQQLILGYFIGGVLRHHSFEPVKPLQLAEWGALPKNL